MSEQQQNLVVPPPMKRVRLSASLGPAGAVAAANTVSTGAGTGAAWAQPLPPAFGMPLAEPAPFGLGATAGLNAAAAAAAAVAAGVKMMPVPMPGVFVPAGNGTAWAAVSPPPCPPPWPQPVPPAALHALQPGASGSSSSSPAASPRGPAGCCSPRAGRRDGRASWLGPAQKVDAILRRFPRSFAQELQIDMSMARPEALFQWLCASILMSARIKSNAAMGACRALAQAGLTTPAAIAQAGQEHVKSVLAGAGYDRYDDKTAGFLVGSARAVLAQYGGDLNRLREEAGRSPGQERVLLKRLKGVGDGAVDIFFRQAQMAWEELYPFADKKSLKAARLMGLREHPQALADLCGGDPPKYVRLLAALVAVDMTKSYADVAAGPA
ncbi:hypothetical protein ABPG77_009889 [Micractinium sp. CCAP 211/92]